MKDTAKLGLAFLAGLLVALGVSGSLNKNNSVDPVKLAEYSACLNVPDSNYSKWVENNPAETWGRPLDVCEYLKP